MPSHYFTKNVSGVQSANLCTRMFPCVMKRFPIYLLICALQGSITYLEEKGADIALGTFSGLVSIHLIYTYKSKDWKWPVS